MKSTWIDLDSIEKVQELVDKSAIVPCLIFKHSTRCSISTVALRRLSEDLDLDTSLLCVYYLDLIQHRHVSNFVAEHFSVYHESPQVLLIVKGECIYEESHLGIHASEIKESIPAIGA